MHLCVCVHATLIYVVRLKRILILVFEYSKLKLLHFNYQDDIDYQDIFRTTIMIVIFLLSPNRIKLWTILIKWLDLNDSQNLFQLKDLRVKC